MSLPPREVPEGLSAEKYLALGQEYIKIGWTEQARDSLQFAVEHNSTSQAREAAARLLKAKIPRFPVPLYAEQRNIEGFNQMSQGDLDGARAIFQELIDEYPDFEWPYGNLSVLLLQAGDTKKAKELLDTALAINNFYVQGWLHLATAKGLELDFDGARRCVEKALDVDPTEAAALAMKDALERMRDL